MNVVLLEPGEIAPDGTASIEGARAAHVIGVLRAAIGSKVRVGVLDGPLGEATIEHVEGGRIALRCVLGETPPQPRLDVLLALPRPKVMGRLYGPLAQLGVGRVMLTNAERVERFYFDAHQLEPAYQHAHLVEGLAQARDTRVPIVTVHKSLRGLIEDDLDAWAPRALSRRVIADPGPHRSIRDACRDLGAEGRVILAIGPEGGWNDFERALLGGHGFEQVAMGARTLRTDVALIALAALVHDAIG